MKNILLILATVGAILISGCKKDYDNMGYPTKITAAAAGDTILIPNHGIYFWDIDNGKGDGFKHSKDMISEPETEISPGHTSYFESQTLWWKWLTYKVVYGTPYDTLIAAPNTTGKSRTLWLVASEYDPQYLEKGATIKITQQKK